jgi:hypothetical protein
MFIGDARDNNISRWGSSRGTRAGQVTNYIHPGITDKGSSLMGEVRGGPPRSSQTEVGHAIDCLKNVYWLLEMLGITIYQGGGVVEEQELDR